MPATPLKTPPARSSGTTISREEGWVSALGHDPHRGRVLGHQGVVAAHADVCARPELGPALANQDIAGVYGFAAELLNAEPAARGIAPVARGAAGFLVSHGK